MAEENGKEVVEHLTPRSERRRGETRVEIFEPQSAESELRGNDAAAVSGDFIWSRSFLRSLRNEATSPTNFQLSAMKPNVRSFYMRQGRVLDSFEEVERLGGGDSADDTSDHDSLLSGERTSSAGAQHGHEGRQYTDIEAANDGTFVVAAAATSPPPQLQRHRHRRRRVGRCGGPDILLTVRQATYVSILFNVVLFVLKLVALIMSGSLSVLSSVVDSALDLFTGVVLFVTQRMMRPSKTDVYKYPAGKRRVEPVAIVICACVMGTASLQLIVESIQSIIKNDADPELAGLSGGILAMSVVTKLGLFLLCRRVDNPSVQALAVDHRNDTLSNVVAIVFGLMGTLVRPWIDPLGGIIIAIYIIYNWYKAGREQAELLVGKTADASVIQQLTFAALHHSPQVMEIDTVRAYHFGTNYIVEVHVVLPEAMALKEAHDIGESLQIKLEKLSHVERAFVHLDFESQHKASDEHLLQPC